MGTGEDAHLEMDYEDRFMNYAEIDDYAFEGVEDEEDDDEVELPYCQIHKKNHVPGGMICEELSKEAYYR